ncbi:MAG: LysM peptidoglycan-binding domain-containing protein [Pedobacter sp.]|nr:MAG: LysM peptidoglycan-binding domain-containing protein [Pedobacter sp.]
MTYYFVKPGQTLYRIALINKVGVNDLMRWNKLTSFTIEVGQKLLVQK